MKFPLCFFAYRPNALRITVFFQAFLLLLSFGKVNAQVDLLDQELSVSKIMATAPQPVRIDKHPLTNELYYMTAGGDVYKVDIAAKSHTKVFSTTNHGLHATTGFDIGKTGNIYLVQAAQSDGYNIATIMKGSPDGDNYNWVKMAETEPYRSSGNRDHQFNAIIESADGEYVLINSGSRTDHGEEAKNGGREMPITSAIIRLPLSAENVILPNEEVALKNGGYIFADGTRNTYDLEYAPNGHLFGAENSDTRDNEEELNWIREGEHYGFPWQIGTHHNPQQYPDFYPPGSDHLLVEGINHEATFYNDPGFPAPPAGISFRKPIANTGPDAAIIRDSVDGEIKSALEIERVMGTFTPHSSPLALTFDQDSVLAHPYTGGGFIMSFNSSGNRKFTPFSDPGEDLLYLRLHKEDETYTTAVHRIAQGFSGPVDAVLIHHKLFVLEYSGANIWEVTFPLKSEAVPAEILIKDSELANQTVIVNTPIEDITVEWKNAEKITVEGLPLGIAANSVSETQTIIIQGTPTQTGTFEYTMSTEGGAPDDSFAGTITVLEDTEVTGFGPSGDPGILDNISIVPNPFSDKLYVRATEPGLVIREVLMYNGEGAFLASIKGDRQGEFSISTRHFLPGIYILKIQTNKGNIVKKGIKVD